MKKIVSVNSCLIYLVIKYFCDINLSFVDDCVVILNCIMRELWNSLHGICCKACCWTNYTGFHMQCMSCRFTRAPLACVVLVLAWWTQSEQSGKQCGCTAVSWQSARVWESSGNYRWGKLGQYLLATEAMLDLDLLNTRVPFLLLIAARAYRTLTTLLFYLDFTVHCLTVSGLFYVGFLWSSFFTLSMLLG